jgi:hypothetical protein
MGFAPDGGFAYCVSGRLDEEKAKKMARAKVRFLTSQMAVIPTNTTGAKLLTKSLSMFTCLRELQAR